MYLCSYTPRYKSLGPGERRSLEEDEDRILASVLHNMVAFMVMVQVDKIQIKRKIRRLLGKAHIGLLHTQPINVLLDHIDKLVLLTSYIIFFYRLHSKSQIHGRLSASIFNVMTPKAFTPDVIHDNPKLLIAVDSEKHLESFWLLWPGTSC